MSNDKEIASSEELEQTYDGSGDVLDAGEWAPKASKGAAKALKSVAEPEPVSEVLWGVQEVADGLQSLSAGAHMMLANRINANVTMTDSEALSIAKPLTDIMNRRPEIRAMAAASDSDVKAAIQLTLASGKYGFRIHREIQAARAIAEIEAAKLADAQQQAARQDELADATDGAALPQTMTHTTRDW